MEASFNLFKPAKTVKKNQTELSVFYSNDIHGNIDRFAKLKKAHDIFEKSNENISSLTLNSGDCFYGRDKKRLGLIGKLLNVIKTDALALGNHEFTAKSKELNEQLKNIDCKAVSCNLELPQGNPLRERLADKKIVKSAVFMKGGQKFAVIGASPFDARIGSNEDSKTAPNVMDADKTIKAINDEAKALEKQGINKIILCSHLGYGDAADLRVARETEGIDVIIGGHTHVEIDGVNSEDKSGKAKVNLVNSKRNEPVIITQAGKLNQKAGFLNLAFDEKGVIDVSSITNKLVDVNAFEEDSEFKKEVETQLGENKVLAKVKNGYFTENEFESRYTENALANHLADAILEASRKNGVQAVLFPTMNIKSGASDELTTYNIKYDMLPYNNTYHAVDINEKDLVKLLQVTGKQLFNDHDPQLLRCGGMKYTIDQDAKNAVTEAQIIDNDGKAMELNVNSPSDTKTFRVALDEYLFTADFSKDILEKYKNNMLKLGKEQDMFSEYLIENKEIDCAKSKEDRITIKYSNLEGFCPQYSMTDKQQAISKTKTNALECV